jgi:hypothetical protein
MVTLENMESSLPSSTYQAFMGSPFRSIKHSTYFQVYDHLFSAYRNKPVTFVEIGVLGGGSLMMWRKFLGPNARIIGIDRNPKALDLQEFGFEIFIGDQGDPKFWNEVVPALGEVDVVLDDGGHTYAQQVETVNAMLPVIRDGGLMVVEDTHTSYMRGFGPRRHSFMRFAQKFADGINKRFGGFISTGSRAASGPVWAIQFFESIVCFYVDRKRAHLLSSLSENMASVELIEDFRFGAPRVSSALIVWLERFKGGRADPALKFISGVAFFSIKIFDWVRLYLNRRYIKIERAL